MPLQDDWRFCGKCNGMFFDGYPDNKGRCPGGEGHSAIGHVFTLPYDEPESATAQHWRFCGKCNGMFFDGYPDNKGRCPGGEGHSAIGYVFALPHSVPETATAQTDWRFCGKCGGMFFDGYPANKGRCPAGDGHGAIGFTFTLPHLPPETLPVARIREKWLAAGGAAGPLGLPAAAPVVHANGDAEQEFAGGNIRKIGQALQARVTRCVRVVYLGFHALAESNEWSASDEPYFLIGVAGSNGSRTVKAGPYQNVDAGESFSDVVEIAGVGHGIAGPVVLVIAAREHDSGTPEEAEAKVREGVQRLEKRIDQAGASMGLLNENGHVMPEWVRTIVTEDVAEFLPAIFGMGDDVIANESRVLYDYKNDSIDWTSYPVVGQFKGNDFSLAIDVGQEGEGAHRLYFLVQLVQVEITVI